MYRNKKGKFCSKVKYNRLLRRKEVLDSKICENLHEEDKGLGVTEANTDRSDSVHTCQDKVCQPGVNLVNNRSHDDQNGKESWKWGRRVVELHLLARQMFCVQCGEPIHLLDIVSERRYGLASILHIKCSDEKCGAVTDVHTGKKPFNGSYDVNYKLALGMIDTGMGPYQVNNLLASLNLPPVDPSTLKRKEKRLDDALESVAKQSCREAQKQEIEKSGGNVEVSFDCGWQKRGTGFNYDSYTGHGSMIGHETGKVVEFALHSKTCHTCSIYADKKETVPAHDCTVTWYGSSKAMEPDMATTMMKDLENSGCPVKVIHGDNDSTTASRLKKNFPSLVKRDDANHIKKSLTSKLYKLSKKYKDLKNPSVIPYIARCFMYCIQSSQHKGEDELKESLAMIVPHLFGDHDMCIRNTWCSYSRNPTEYRFRSLPNGKPLSDDNLRRELVHVVSVYQDRAQSLVNIGSTQSNENFNFIVSTKAPKYKSFGSSKSLLGRLSASVLQKNEGRSYIGKMNRFYGLSPGQYTTKLAEKITSKRHAAKEKNSTVACKRKRMMKKIKKKKQDLVSVVHEGATYQSQIELDEEVANDITDIPKSETVNIDDAFVIFDLETCGLGQKSKTGRKSEILQIAAIESKSESSFNVYVKPRCEVPTRASDVHGITYDHDKNEMCHHSKLVESKVISNGLLDFIDFVKVHHTPILVGHNITSFDIPVLLNSLQEHGLATEFTGLVKGFVDTLSLSKKVFTKDKVQNFKQETLVKEFTNCTYDAHDAKEDVTALNVLFNSKLLSAVGNEDLHDIKYHATKRKYQNMLESKCISNAVVSTLARLGIQPGHLKLALSRHNKGIQMLLKSLNIKCKTTSAMVKFLEKEE